MSGAVDGRVARSAVVELGDRVRAEGRFVRLDGADWLDLAQVHTLVGRTGPWKSDRSVRLIGVDAAAIPAVGGADSSVMPEHLQVVGVWHEDVIDVEAQAAVAWPTTTRSSFTLPAPVGGWDVDSQSQNVEGLEALRATGAIVRDGWLRERSGAVVLRVAASDVDAVQEALSLQLPRRMYVVQSRYTRAQLREVEDVFSAHAREWGFENWSDQGLDEQCQPYADVMLTRVSTGMASWAETLPAKLLTMHPAMTPA
jgi:hypothetical protein